MTIATSLIRGVIGWGGAFASAVIPLTGWMFVAPQVDPFDNIVIYVLWWGALGLLVGLLARNDPGHAWRLAAAVEFGFLCGVVFAMVIALRFGERMNLWPLTLLWSLLVSAPAVIVGVQLGRKRGAILDRPSHSE